MNNRNYGLDLLRAVLMLIGVLFHAAVMLTSDAKWLNGLSLEKTNIFYDLIYSTHMFRMQAFFLLAGFFSMLVISRKNKEYFISNRKRRVLVPLFFSMITISPSILYFSSNNSDFYSFLTDISVFSLVQHLWFLITLMILSLLTYKGKLNRLIKISSKLSKIKLLFYIIIINFLVFSAYGLVTKLDNTESEIFINIYRVFITPTIVHGAYYVIGCTFFKDKERVVSLQSPCVRIVVTPK